MSLFLHYHFCLTTWVSSCSTVEVKLVPRASQATHLFFPSSKHTCTMYFLFWLLCSGCVWSFGPSGHPWGPLYHPVFNRVLFNYSNTNKSQDINIVLRLSFLFFRQSPQAGTKDKTLCCWFCTSGPISLSAKIERKGYTPGNVSYEISYIPKNQFFSLSLIFLVLLWWFIVGVVTSAQHLVAFCRRIDSDLRRDRELLLAHGRAKGCHLPNSDLFCQGKDEGDQAACGQHPWGVAVFW